MQIYEKLQFIKQITSFSQERLSEELEVSFPTLNSWINGKSIPHKKSQDRINDLYHRYTGQALIPKNVLAAKKDLIFAKVKEGRTPLKTILSRPDLYDTFLLTLTYNTNSIEGSTLSINETAAVLFQNKNIPNKSLIEQMEVKNHQAAFHFLFQHLNNNQSIDEKLILKLHSILMNGIRDDAGLYRQHGVRILGSNVPTANPLKVPDLMKKISSKLKSNKKDSIKWATIIHSEFEKIHPFSDGNGRIGRLLLIAMLLKANIAPAIIKQDDKQLYYAYLKKSQMHQDYSLLEDFICDAIFFAWELMRKGY